MTQPPTTRSPSVGDLPAPATRRRAATRNPYSPVMLVVSIMATIGVLAYAWFLLNPANRGDPLPWLIVIVAEVILIFNALMSMWTILSGSRSPRDFDFHAAKRFLFSEERNHELGVVDQPTQWPLHLHGREVTADILITVYGEPVEKIRRTVVAAQEVHGAHHTWILDDGNSAEVAALAAELQCGYIRRLSNTGAKAGNINNALSIAKAEYFVVLDADFVVRPNFLEETLPFMQDEHVAFVQTPQTYGNLHSVIAKGAAYMQTMFYRFIQPGRNQFNAAFCVGTNVLYRRTAVLDVGGIYTQSKSEDVWTSLMLHERGWKTVYIPDTLAVGDAPETIEAYSKQQLRWATGGFEILFTHNPLSPRRRLTLDQRVMYFVTATHYLSGIVPGLLLFLPALEVFFDLRPVNLDVGIGTWVLFYLGFYGLQVLLAFLTLGSFRWQVFLLAANSFPIYVKAFRNALTGVDTKWSVTGATDKKNSAFNYIIPQVLVFVLLLATTIVSIWRDLNMDQVNLATFWAGLNTVVVAALIVVAFGEDLGRGRATPVPEPDPVNDWERSGVVPLIDRDQIMAAQGRVNTLAAGGDLGDNSGVPVLHPPTSGAQNGRRPLRRNQPGSRGAGRTEKPNNQTYAAAPPPPDAYHHEADLSRSAPAGSANEEWQQNEDGWWFRTESADTTGEDDYR